MGKCPIPLCKSLFCHAEWMLGVSQRRAAPTQHFHFFSWVPLNYKASIIFGCAAKETAMGGP